MGTRSVTCVYQGGQYRVAQYEQCDGYPDEVGVRVLKFIRKVVEHGALEEFAQKVSQCWFLTDEEAEALSLAYENDTFENRQRLKTGPSGYLFEDRASVAVLQAIMRSEEPLAMSDSYEFIASPSAAWVYVIDLDLGTFETYQGYNDIPLGPEERFYHLYEKTPVAFKENPKFLRYPARFIRSFRLDDLPMPSEYANSFLDDDEEYEVKYCDELDSEHLATIVLTRRPDGGVRVHSTDMPGLHLSHGDPNHLSSCIVPAILALRDRRWES